MRALSDYSPQELETSSLWGFCIAANRHLESAILLNENDDPSKVIYSIELLLYTSIEMHLKLINVLCILLTESAPTESTDFHEKVLLLFKKNNHRLDSMLASIRALHDPIFENYFSNLNIEYSEYREPQPASDFYLITAESEQFTINSSFATRYPGYSKKQGQDVSSVWVSTDSKFAFVKRLAECSKDILNKYIDHIYRRDS